MWRLISDLPVSVQLQLASIAGEDQEGVGNDLSPLAATCYMHRRKGGRTIHGIYTTPKAK